jgi:Na+-driven multidrug efflux pump
MGIQMTIMVTFQALGKPVLGAIMSLGRQCLFYIPLLFMLDYFWGFQGFVFSLADVATAILSVVLVRGLLKELKHCEE